MNARSGPAVLDRRTRLLRALTRATVDRAPVICTGGNMSAAPAAVVRLSGFSLPQAHTDPLAMAGLALAAARLTGFESVGVPLCTTVEAEVFGAPVLLGDEVTEARVTKEPSPDCDAVPRLAVAERLRLGRVQTSVAAVRELARTAGDLPIIANLIGPVSVAASVVEPLAFYRELIQNPLAAQDLVAHINEFLIAWAGELVAAGADAVAIHEDSATPALIGPRVFERITLPALETLITAIQGCGAPVLLHMCGALGRAEGLVARLRCKPFIPDASLGVAELRERLPHLAIVGNLSTFLLHLGEREQIADIAARLIRDGVDCLAPTCGMSSLTPLANIRAMTGAVTGAHTGAVSRPGPAIQECFR
ncbi:uroporphyrinogen decarboxylase family protein [uncultured Thiodictyon sp.]|uniref:uroporphyrinogen decarboxylase family protein n=1 Tax=uncultured Thiodictyon sp. TaxID=1846217 RepID=UPI0025D4925F|nr:uroporphyrinogen decarboxylase family protein [uncultured Thiodictyon sp.]